mgnify:CR=1 FL=1
MPLYVNLIIEVILIIIGICLFFYIITVSIAYEKEQRLTRFSINGINTKQPSFTDKLLNFYYKIINYLSKIFKKSKILTNYSKKYEIYVDKTSFVKSEAINFISIKFFVSFLCVFITIISDVIRVQYIYLPQLSLAFVLGFFIYDVFLIFEKKNKYRKLENDLLKAVIIMSNAFKSGRSIVQAIELVILESDGRIKEEFKKIKVDLNYGLDYDVVFNRFAKRLNIEEAYYMSTSLIILNKTGGNISKIFTTIEKSFFDRKKLKDELSSAIAVSELVFKILVFIPIFIFLVIFIIDRTYFVPLFTTLIGKIILVLCIIIYISYIIVVKRITKLKD